MSARTSQLPVTVLMPHHEDHMTRPLTDYERELLEALIGPGFPAREAALEQLRRSKAAQIDENGSLSFVFEEPVDKLPELKHAIPSEAELEDEDGVVIHLLLHAGKRG